jgi:hypothetical protein
MPSMTAGMLDHRNIGSNVSLALGDDGTISGALATVFQSGNTTTIVLAHDDDEIVVDSNTRIEVALPTAAAYTLGLKNAVEELLTKLDGQAG